MLDGTGRKCDNKGLRHLKGKSLHNLRLLSSVAIGALLLAAPNSFAKEPVKYHHGVIIRFQGEIGPRLQRYLYRQLDAAKQQGADLVVLEIDSPGGRLKESLEIAERLQNLDWAHTVAYIPHRAISGAAIVSLGCDEILMAPQAVIGDAGAIFMDEHSLLPFRPPEDRSVFLPLPCAASPKPKGVRRPWPRPWPTRISRYFMFAI